MFSELVFRRLLFMILLLILLTQVLDASMTLYGIEQTSHFGEANPLIKKLMDRFGVREGLLLMKSGVLVLIVGVFVASFRPIRSKSWILIGALAGLVISSYPVYLWVVTLRAIE